MPRTRLFRGIALLAALVVFALLASRIAWPQQPYQQPAPYSQPQQPAQQPAQQPPPQYPAQQPPQYPAQQPPQYPARVFPRVGEEAVYTSAGVGELGSSASVAWFIATPTKGDAYPIACKFAGESFTCKKGTFQ